ncbi:MAG TPA: glutamate 5-kinase [Pseudogracilibacillus sp.]|nr:glutamate 5-kinase [Pseudogracilibacillus sp.]
MKKQRVVVKIGSSSLTNDRGEIDEKKLADHVKAVAAIRAEGHEVILVSSGAVAAGFLQLGYPSRPVTIKGKQASAAVGQSLLIQSYIDEFNSYELTPAQVLLTRGDFSDKDRFQNAFATLSELLDRGIIPIINENDTVAVDELTFGDNDMLSALVSGFLHADQLILLTDINGLYDSNPRKNPDAKKYDYLEEITDDMMQGADSTGSKVGTGGMYSKLQAANKALSLGVKVFIGTGEGEAKLTNIISGKGDGTYIVNDSLPPINTGRQWIAFHSEPTGKLFVDKGAEEAILHHGRSLLPAGVYKVSGTFAKGDVVEVHGETSMLGKGQVNTSSDDIRKYILERNKRRHEEKRNRKPATEVIHRDRWVELSDHI